MKCSVCNTDNADNEKFCDSCGAKLTPGGQPPSPPISPDPVAAMPPMQQAQGIGIKCPHCPGTHPSDLPFCPDTGLPLTQETTPSVCSCGTALTPGAKFCLNCGAKVPAGGGLTPAMTAALVFPDGVRMEITGGELVIERKDFSRLVSAEDAKFIGRNRHAVIRLESGKYYVLDENSANGTKLNGREIKGAGKQELNDNDIIEVAEVAKITFKLA